MVSKIIANWKCNMKFKNINSYFDSINNYDFNSIDIGIAVPSVFLSKSIELINNHQVQIYAQDFESHKYGSFTGRISYEHLLDLNVQYVIIGHSEQRCFNGNTDIIINQKILTALDNGFHVVLCIGEPLEIYQTNQAITYLKQQLLIALANLKPQHLDQLTIAYEPIWSIGTGLLLNIDEIEKVIQAIRDYVKELFKNMSFDIKYLYGGSVNLNNIETFGSIKNIDGFLIGSASLNDKVFLEMVDVVKQWKK